MIPMKMKIITIIIILMMMKKPQTQIEEKRGKRSQRKREIVKNINDKSK
jgi:energy-converting hydrogenase Eha subunit H